MHGCSRSDILELFDNIDANLSGQLRAEDLRLAFNALGSAISEKELTFWIWQITEGKCKTVRKTNQPGSVCFAYLLPR
jgi:Ca2+-binding EF-hand superfamily protein